MARLRVTSALLRDQTFELRGEYFTIGREAGNTIRLDHTSVSKQHALLKVSGEDYLLLDLHSTNGIVVNGRRGVVHHLINGDRIVLGEIELRFETGQRGATQPILPTSLLKSK